MREWNMKGPLCGGCYSRLIAEFYPGEHARMGSQDGGGGGSGDKTAGSGAGGRPDTPGAAGPPSGASGGGACEGGSCDHPP